MTKKSFKFQYCIIRRYDESNNEKAQFEFTPFITKFLNLPKNEYVIDICDYKAKIEKINQIQKRYIHISFVKMVDKALPKKVFADERDSLDIEMKDDEYLGTDVHIIYDTDNGVLMLQKTRESLSIANISCYLNEFAHKLNLLNESQVIEILPIYDTNTLSPKSIVKKIDIRFANIEEIKYSEYNNIWQMFDTFNKFNAISGCITMSVGRTKNKLNNDEIMSAINIVKQLKSKYHNCISGAKISYVEGDNTFSYDLFDDVMNDIGYIDVSPRESIKFEDVETEMLKLYNKKLPHINYVISK